MQTEVLIVGAGPTGLALATSLAQAGIPAMTVDRLAGGQNTSRAAVIHAHTLEVLDTLGVAARLEAEGLRLSRFCIRDRDRALLRLGFDWLPTRHPHLLMLPQDRTEAILANALARAGGTVRRGWEVTALRETGDGVRVGLANGSARETVLARYVVGADGMNSVVRQAANIGFSGHGYEQSFMLADVEMSWQPGREEVSLFFSPAGLVVVAPLPGADRFRVVATLDHAPEQPAVADVQALLDARGPSLRAGEVRRVLWGSRFHLHHRIANHYRRGRMLLVGDAAHVHSPAGGQGMNTGLVDACVLGQLLADVVSGRCEDRHLDQYERLRRPAARQVMHLVARLTGMATMRGAPQRTVRNAVLGLANHLPAARHRLEMNLSGLARRDGAAPVLTPVFDAVVAS